MLKSLQFSPTLISQNPLDTYATCGISRLQPANPPAGRISSIIQSAPGFQDQTKSSVSKSSHFSELDPGSLFWYFSLCYEIRILSDLYLAAVTVDFMGQLDWAMGYPGIWLNTISGMSVSQLYFSPSEWMPHPTPTAPSPTTLPGPNSVCLL